MAQVIITLKIMPESPDSDLSKIQKEAERLIKDFKAEVGKVEEQPVAFGLRALLIYIISDEKNGDTEPLEKRISEIAGVNSVDVIDVRRAVEF